MIKQIFFPIVLLKEQPLSGKKKKKITILRIPSVVSSQTSWRVTIKEENMSPPSSPPAENDEGEEAAPNTARRRSGRRASSTTRRRSQRRAAAQHECPECGKVYQRARSLKEHMTTHSGEKVTCNGPQDAVCGRYFLYMYFARHVVAGRRVSSMQHRFHVEFKPQRSPQICAQSRKITVPLPGL